MDQTIASHEGFVLVFERNNSESFKRIGELYIHLLSFKNLTSVPVTLVELAGTSFF